MDYDALTQAARRLERAILATLDDAGDPEDVSRAAWEFASQAERYGMLGWVDGAAYCDRGHSLRAAVRWAVREGRPLEPTLRAGLEMVAPLVERVDELAECY